MSIKLTREIAAAFLLILLGLGHSTLTLVLTKESKPNTVEPSSPALPAEAPQPPEELPEGSS